MKTYSMPVNSVSLEKLIFANQCLRERNEPYQPLNKSHMWFNQTMTLICEIYLIYMGVFVAYMPSLISLFQFFSVFVLFLRFVLHNRIGQLMCIGN